MFLSSATTFISSVWVWGHFSFPPISQRKFKRLFIIKCTIKTVNQFYKFSFDDISYFSLSGAQLTIVIFGSNKQHFAVINCIVVFRLPLKCLVGNSSSRRRFKKKGVYLVFLSEIHFSSSLISRFSRVSISQLTE